MRILMPMIAFQATFPTYGCPLPTPRDSVSAGRGGNQPRGSIAIANPNALSRKPVRLTAAQALSVANGFAEAVAVSGHRLLACAILPRQVSVVVELQDYRPELVVGHLKRASALRLKRDGRHPFQEECEAAGLLVSCWGPSWFEQLQTPSQVLATVRAVESTPQRAGKPRQHWRFVERTTQRIQDAVLIA